MPQLTRDRYLAEIRDNAATLAEIASTQDPELRVPTCPDWNLRQLATHVGRVHRWAAETVSTRATERLAFSAVPDGAYPVAAADRAAWLTSGAARVITAIEEAGEDLVWAFGRLAPASFWARRQAHETVMHRVDAELAAGRDIVIDGGLAADGIDEWLGSVTTAGYRHPGDGTQALPGGAGLHLLATGDGSNEAAEWVVRCTSDGRLSLRHGPGDGDATLRGPADRLLLVLVRRLPADDPAVQVTGDRELLTGWLAATAF